MGNAWSTHKSKREEKAKAKRCTVVRLLDFTSRINSQIKVSTTFSFSFFTGYGTKIASVVLTFWVFQRDYLCQHLT